MQTKLLMKNWSSFVKLCLKAETEKQIVDLFDLFFTDAEQEDIATRYAIIEALLLGEKTQRELAKQLKVSTAKITRGSNALRVASHNVKKIIERKN